MLVDTVTAVMGGVGSMVVLVGAMVGAVQWIVRREVAPLRERLDDHRRQHDRERKQVAAAFKRNSMYPPDGWNGVRDHSGSRSGGGDDG